MEVVALKGYGLNKLVAEHGLGRHFASSFKSQLDPDWDDAGQKRAVVGQLVADARVALELAKAALRGYASDAEQTQSVRDARGLLAELMLQDIDEDPDDGDGPQIRQGTARDRIVSTTDPEMRHGRKSSSKRFDGYKASVAIDTKAGVVLSTDVLAGNAHDAEGAGDLVKQASEAANREVERVLGDTAYGTSRARREIAEATNGAEVVAKVPPATSRKGAEFTVEDFKIDIDAGVATCPAGKKSIRHRRPRGTTAHRFTFSRNDCTACPMRSKCTTAKVGARAITIAEGYHELRRLRRRQRTKRFKQIYRRRTKVEHRLARLVQLGVRQARYLGRRKAAFQVCIAAAVANLVLACGQGSSTAGRPSRGLANALNALRFFCGVIRAAVFAIVATMPAVFRFSDRWRPAHRMAICRPGF